MRQAIVIKNPKWESFTAVSDVFKSADGPAVLVVRGRCKEKKADKVIHRAKKSLAVICLLFACLTSNAQQNIISYLPATQVITAATNTTEGPGLIGWNVDQVAVLQLTVVSTNTAAGTFIVRLGTSDNGNDFVASQYSITATANGTTAATAIARITNSVGGKWLRVDKMENLSANTVTVQRFTISIKQ